MALETLMYDMFLPGFYWHFLYELIPHACEVKYFPTVRHFKQINYSRFLHEYQCITICFICTCYAIYFQ